jgi:hypothetical protein
MQHIHHSRTGTYILQHIGNVSHLAIEARFRSPLFAPLFSFPCFVPLFNFCYLFPCFCSPVSVPLFCYLFPCFCSPVFVPLFPFPCFVPVPMFRSPISIYYIYAVYVNLRKSLDWMIVITIGEYHLNIFVTAALYCMLIALYRMCDIVC